MGKSPYPQRFFERLRIDSSGCWFLRGKLDGMGYATIGAHGLAHRWSYERFRGPIPDGLTIDHLCHNESEDCMGGKSCLHRGCVNPGHLMLKTRAQNVLASPRSRAAQNALKTHCPKGHELSGDNLYLLPHRHAGRLTYGRVCRTCGREDVRRRRATKRGDTT